METTVKQRLVEFLKCKKIGQKKFEIACGFSNGFVNSIRQSISPKKIQQIALCYPDLNTGWILTGEGSMLRDDGAAKMPAESSAIVERLHEKIVFLEKENAHLNSIIKLQEELLDEYRDKKTSAYEDVAKAG